MDKRLQGQLPFDSCGANFGRGESYESAILDGSPTSCFGKFFDAKVFHAYPKLFALQTFKPLVDNVGLYKGPKGWKYPVEFLSDLMLDFQDCNKLKVITVSIEYLSSVQSMHLTVG